MKSRAGAKTEYLAKIGLFVAVITVCAWISLPFAIPFTLQTLGVFLTLCVLGGKGGVIAVLAYLLLGFVGVPVFSAFSGGVAPFFGAGGGYLIGFLLAALLFWGLERAFGGKRWGELLSLLLGQVVCYLAGSVWFALVYTGGEVGFWGAIATCVLPYLLPDAVKIAVAFFLGKKFKRKIAA